MNKEKQKMIPEVRFPEFKNDGEWKIEPFNDVYNFKITNSFSREKLNYEKGNVKNIHYGDIHTKFSSHFDITQECVPYINLDITLEKIDKDNYCQEGDLVIADASEDIDDIGKTIEIISLNQEKLLAGLHTFLARPIDDKIKLGFGGHLFKSNGIIAQIKNEAQGAKVLGISKGRLANLDVYYPDSDIEQQKIANCLSSLDTLITAEVDKLENLKDHKTGLLQRLFPANGETKPEFRFPEFEKDGDWEEKLLGGISEITTGTSNRQDSTEEEGKYTFFDRSQDIRTSNRFLFDGEAIIVAGEGQEFKPKYFIGKFDLHQRAYAILNFNNKTIGKFLYYSIYKNRSYFLRYAVGSTVKSLRLPIFENMPTLISSNPKEQQKIADCLTSVDDFIEAQKTRIKVLKNHKKGLMQQLFPNSI
ncbi:restriction endonuclease subunit S [Maribacter sp. BPC-D8]|uniref:restriction endonuclease subunit S n=1 Tax=Maribacter sp. BPC-D8 TaxID=3053613 RepID=UPI002B4A2D35|nr:restriction endonuclease subunit S [Maribacter sp. BPC-D8]WRI28105.1 restriction endonuclease subunit S [Maribacter sp. BPC-D8]